jgi:preprotein translocase subunit SecG
MSKLLKVIVNTLLLLAILSAGALVIPPFAGITTLVSDGMGNTNISRGAVTYAKKTDTSSVATGDKILVDDNSGKYIYTIQSLDTAAGTASVKNVISGDTTEITVRATVSKVIVTIPVIGFLSMAAQSREGIMIIGLAVLFLVILFILSEVWKRDEEEDEEEEEEEEEDEDEDDEKASEELRSRKKAALEEKKKREEQEMTEQLRAADQKTAEEEKQDEFEIPDLEEEGTEQVSFNTVDLQNLVRGEETEEIPEAVEETEIVEEAAAEETAEEVTEETEETESAEPGTVEEIEEFEETIEEPEPEPSEPIELAMPVYTAEELLQKAHAAGDDPKVIEDPATGITILDYSDIL